MFSLAQKLRALGLRVTEKPSQTTSSLYLIVALYPSEVKSHPRIVVRIGDHEPNPERARKMGLDVNISVIDAERKAAKIAEDIKTMLMRRWANKRGRKISSI